MDIAAQSVVDVGLAAEVPDSALNLVHPRPIVYATLIKLVVRELSIRESRSQYPLLQAGDWLSHLLSRFNHTGGPKRKNIVSVLVILKNEELIFGNSRLSNF